MCGGHNALANFTHLNSARGRRELVSSGISNFIGKDREALNIRNLGDPLNRGIASKNKYERIAGTITAAAFGSYGLGAAFGGGAAAGGGAEAGGSAGLADTYTAPEIVNADTIGTDVASNADSVSLANTAGNAGNTAGGAIDAGGGADYSSVNNAWGDNPTGNGPGIDGPQTPQTPKTPPSFMDSVKANLTSMKGIAGDIQLAGGLYGLNQGLQQNKAAAAAAKQQRDYQSQLADLSANPNKVKDLPGFKAGLDLGNQALLRQLASQGRTGSGSEMAELQQFNQMYMQGYLNQEQQRLAKLAGMDMGGNPAASQKMIGSSLNNLVDWAMNKGGNVYG